MLALIASASSGVPSVKVTPSCSVKSQVSPSSLVSHSVASQGWILPSASRPTIGSRYCVEISACG